MITERTGAISLQQLFETARFAAPCEALQCLTFFTAGIPGYLTVSRLALVSALDDAFAIVTPEAIAIESDVRTPIADRVLQALGLRLLKLEGAAAGTSDALLGLGSLILRLGLMARTLDITHRHLSPRTSFGQKVLKHQLVRAEFARAHGVMEQIRQECDLLAEPGRPSLQDTGVQYSILQHHKEIGALSADLSKLMGGHGYLLGNSNSLDYLSSLIRSLYAPKEVVKVHSYRVSSSKTLRAAGTPEFAQ